LWVRSILVSLLFSKDKAKSSLCVAMEAGNFNDEKWLN
jgi:hypothetical protein